MIVSPYIHEVSIDMQCPFCQADDTKVMDSRLVVETNQVRRRRSCQHCEVRFTTYETAELVMPRVIKSDGTRVAFDEEKMRRGMLRALEKRPVSVDAIDQAIAQVLKQIRTQGEREISARKIGHWIMQQLMQLDDVAYVRFASVYRHFKDLDAFREEIDKLINVKPWA